MAQRLNADAIENKVISVDLIDPHESNYNQHPDEQISQLAQSHTEFGQYRSIVVVARPGGRYTQVAGHGYLQAAKGEGLKEVRCDVLPEDTPAETVKAILVADNEHARHSTQDDEALAQLLQEQVDAGFDLAALGSDEETLRQMLDALGDGYLSGGGEDEDDFEAEPDEEQTRVQVGDVWQLGRHTIACMSATDLQTYEKLVKGKDVQMVWSDPPYGISLLKDRGAIGLSKAYDPVMNDGDTDVAIKSFALAYQQFPSAVHIWWGANYYADALPPSACWIVWDKDHHGMTFADAELAWVNQDQPTRCFRHAWSGAHRDSERGEDRIHPTQKPVALALWCYERFGNNKDVIFDPFLGSGMSVIAAEQLNRTVIGCELSPAYINKILSRWESHTNQTAQLISRIEEVVNA